MGFTQDHRLLKSYRKRLVPNGWHEVSTPIGDGDYIISWTRGIPHKVDGETHPKSRKIRRNVVEEPWVFTD